MNRIKFFKTVKLIAVILFTAANAHAQGSDTHGGSQIFKDGKWQISDRYVVAPSENGDFLILSEGMKTYLKFVNNLSHHFIRTKNDGLGDLFRDLLDAHTQYIFMKPGTPLPCQDEPLSLPFAMGPQKSFGCTLDGITYLLRDQYDLPTDTIEDKALKLIHERVHAYVDAHHIPGIEHNDIALFVHGLSVMLDLVQEQSKPDGGMRILNPLELDSLEKFYDYAIKLKFADDWRIDQIGWESFFFTIHPYGGGVLIGTQHHFVDGILRKSAVEVDDGSFISVDSSVFSYHTIIHHSQIWNSVITLGEVSIENSLIKANMSIEGDKSYSCSMDGITFLKSTDFSKYFCRSWKWSPKIYQ
jgi:hypothetical protein